MIVPEEIIKLIETEDRFLIASHLNPEGDALGTTIALYLALKSLGKNVIAYNVDGVPYLYEFLPYSEVLKKDLDGINTEEYILMLVDCNEPERASVEKKRFKKALVIDHHLTQKEFGDIKWIEPQAPATGVLAYHLIKALGVEISKDIAINLYTALSIDTGTFRYDNTTSETLRLAAELIDCGADPAETAIKLYESWTYKRFQLLVRMLQTLEIIDVEGCKIALTYITLDMFRETETTQADTENFSNFARMIEDVDVSVMLRETEQRSWKISMRGKGRVNLARLASDLGGGGHRNAAGFRAEGLLEDIKNRLIDAVRRLLHQ